MKAVIIANGPSLTAEDVAYCKGRGLVIAVNDAYRLAPFADVLYACDGDWWDHHVATTVEFRGSKWTADDEAARRYRLNHVKVRPDLVWSTDHKTVAGGGNSGFQAINLAAHWGYKDIVLLGFDYQTGEDGEEHWFGAHPDGLRRQSQYREWVRRIAKAAPLIEAAGVRVTNCTRRTAITCFANADLQEVL